MFSSDFSLKKIIALIAIAIVIYHYGFPDREIKQSPGVLVSEDPVQENINNPKDFEFKDYTITPLADFSITARVLSKENYQFDTESDLSPTDLALGWGLMSDSQVLKNISISQSNRWYHWSVEEFPIPQRDIETHSANMHMIPADDSVRSMLKTVHAGNVISLHGKLVRITNASGWHWQSSMTRDDTGGGACEVIWVEDFYIKS